MKTYIQDNILVARTKIDQPRQRLAMPFPQLVLWTALAAVLGSTIPVVHAGVECIGVFCTNAEISGKGADGHNGESRFWANGDPGGDGGRGDNRVIELKGIHSISSGNPYALLVDVSGGNGGAGGKSDLAAYGVGGSGGNGGAITLKKSSPSAVSRGVWLWSAGGNAGKGRDASAHASRTLAGMGGDIIAVFDKDTTLTSNGQGAAALWAESRGGNGSEGRILAAGTDEKGGGGAKAGNVKITANGQFQSHGHESAAIRIKSMGGNTYGTDAKGNGGAAGVAGLILGSQDPAGSASRVTVKTTGVNAPAVHVMNQGGSGGGGQNAGGTAVARLTATPHEESDVYVTVGAADITTQDSLSTGVLAESYGGEGGKGANGQGGLGQAGGAGGMGGKVNVLLNKHSDISTTGTRAHGAFVVSKGGDGGQGGRGGINEALRPYPGGVGGAGGEGGDVTVAASGKIKTERDDAYGIYAASLGGKAGQRGDSAANDGRPGTAGKVTLSHSGSLQTQGSGSHGLVAQNVGGGGGVTFTRDSSLGPSAHYGTDARGGAVDLTNTGVISTSGEGAYGAFAQSIGGGGGSGGSTAGIAAVGGDGQSGGIGGNVSAKIGGVGSPANTRIETTGHRATGVFAQSVGGGGGDGGGAVSIGVGYGVAIGGKGGAGGPGGKVEVALGDPSISAVASSGPKLITRGDHADAIFAQSVGGGGGTGGEVAAITLGAAASIAVGGKGGGGGNGGIVNINTHSGSVLTEGADSVAINAQSVGGGGGSGGDATAATFGLAAITVGGEGGGGGKGGEITVSNRVAVTTRGSDSVGILAQSIGGGGGVGGSSTALAIAIPTPKVAMSFAIAVGGKGGDGGDGGKIRLDNVNSILTEGDGARGINLQSIGGGGGQGGSASAKSISMSSGANLSVSVGIGGKGGKGGAGGDITLTNSSTIRTTGAQATAATLQSIGGGGGQGGAGAASASTEGAQGFSLSFSAGGSGGTANNGGTITATNSGAVLTTGAMSRGVLIQTIGGGGGEGAGADGDAKAGKVSAALTLGSKGGAGGAGGAVTFSNEASGHIETAGRGADGLLVQSIGGGGGVAGVVGAASELEKAKAAEKAGTVSTAPMAASPSTRGSHSVAMGFTLGGDGGRGGVGGDVIVTNHGVIGTLSDQASGILVQSIGGGGGKAAAAKSSATGGDISLTAAIGGKGGTSGKGGEVTVTNSGRIVTEGEGSYAVLAQSIGGGGGSASSSDANAEGGKLAVALSLGGAGGAAGEGGKVTVTNSGDLVTYGSTAVLVQSIGGGGGEGGSTDGKSTVKKPKDEKKPASSAPASNIASAPASQPAFKTQSASIQLGVGGKGGASGKGGEITVDNVAKIITYGDYSIAIQAQSIGGGGGKGGSSQGTASGADINAVLSIGGSGGSSGDGGLIKAANNRAIVTQGLSSHAVLAQSIGGGGGSAGNAQSSTSGQISIGGTRGGSGGAAGQGGRIELTNNAGAIETQGYGAVGLYAQSIGGGGGDGASSKAKSDQGDGKSVNVNLAIGGGGGSAGKGGELIVTQLAKSSITTYGDQADAIRIQSIGGGGGSGDTGTVIAAKKEEKKEEGKNAKKDDKKDEKKPDQYTVGAALGGDGGASGDGGKVTLMLAGESSLTTHGEQAVGILAQSIGGGGGKAAIGAVDAEYGTVALTFKLGGTGGAAGQGGVVDIANGGSLLTHGVGAHGMLVQSIGGGGGAAGSTGGKTDDKVGIELGAKNSGAGGAGNRGGRVDVRQQGRLATKGAGAYGILAQSIGGGGGYAADTSSLVLGKLIIPTSSLPATGARGAGGNVTIDVSESGRIVTEGKNAAGILAQSIGGGGGLSNTVTGASSSGQLGAGGAVRVNVSGHVLASGENSPGIFIQSLGGKAQTDIAVSEAVNANEDSTVLGKAILTIKANGIVQGGTGQDAAGVILGGGVYEQRVDIEKGGRLYGLNGRAVFASNQSTPSFINNYGTLQGDVILGGGRDNKLVNGQSGYFEAGAVIDIGTGNEFLNHGVFNVGAPVGSPRNYATTRLTGNYVQSGYSGGSLEGVYEPAVDFRDQKAGVLSVNGDIALDGLVRPKGRYQLPDQLVTVMETQGSGHTLTTKDTLHTANPLVYTYTLKNIDDKQLQVGVTADFTKPEGLSEDHANLAANIQNKWNSVPVDQLRDYAEVFDHFANVTTIDEYRQALTQMANDAKQAPVSNLPGKSRTFIQLMMSCPEFRSDDASMQEGSCYWGRVLGNDTRLKSSSEDHGFHSNSVTYQIGGQKEISPGWILGGSVAYEDSRNRASGTPVRTDGKLFNAGVVLKRQQGPWLFAGALNVGYGRYNTDRVLNVSGVDRHAESDWKSQHAGARLRASYVHAEPTWYVKPLFDIDLAYQRVPGYSETGAGVFNLELQKASRWNVTLAPAVEIGGRINTQYGTLRPYVSVGASWMSDNSWAVNARLQGDPLHENFRMTTSMPKLLGEVKTGVELISGKGFELKAEYEVRFASRYVNQTGILRLAKHF